MKASIRDFKTGLTFTVRLVCTGGKYGARNCLTHDKAEPLVEFYDDRYPMSQDPNGEHLGQFVSRYYAETLLEARTSGGLCLDGGNAEVWTLDAVTMRLVRDLIRNWLGRY